MNPFNLILALLLGLSAAGISYAFQSVIIFSDKLRLEYPELVLALPILFIITALLKKKTLYYPYKIKDLNEMTQQKNFFWNRWKSFYHFIGAGLSHIFGASVGREGVIVLTTTGIVRLFNMSLLYWGPVAASIGFAAITGNKWVGIIFLIEMYTTNFSQKLLSFLGGWFAILVLESVHFPHLLRAVNVPDTESYFKRFLFILILGILIGYIARAYKKGYFFLSDFFAKKNIVWAIAMSAAVGYALYNPVLRPLQSLSLDTLERFSSGALMLELDMQMLILKLSFTLICVSLGFFGGEYVPLVLVGAGFGAVGAQYYGESLLMGSALGAFAVFAGVTRLKWTAIFLCLSLTGPSMFFWVYLFYSVVEGFAGEDSIYFEKSTSPKSFMKFHFANFQNGEGFMRGFDPRDFKSNNDFTRTEDEQLFLKRKKNDDPLD